jgi:hypothetical protein
MPAQPNPDTHCTSCGEVLSEYHHCWQCHWPPMDPKQDGKPSLRPIEQPNTDEQH